MQMMKRQMAGETLYSEMNQLIETEIRKINGFNSYLRNRQKRNNS